MGVTPDFKIPVGDRAIAVERCLQPRHHRRPERLPSVLLLAHPLYTDGNTRQFTRNQRGISRGIIRPVVAVTPGALDMDTANAGRRHAQHLRDGLAIGIDTLSVGPDGHDAIDRLRDRAGRADRAVSLVGTRIAGVQAPLASYRRV